MSSQPLLQSNPTAAKSYVEESMSPIQRYNIFIDCYNTPTNMIDTHKLQNIPDSPLYNNVYRQIITTKGKIIFFILSILPVIDVALLFICAYFDWVYFSSLKTHQKNKEVVTDPFKKMTFDPEMCYTMNCDYYFFNIELKELDGFSLNYQQKMSHQLNLRKERGKTSLMIYNANFWAHYNHFANWKPLHLIPLFTNILLCVSINTIFFFFIFR